MSTSAAKVAGTWSAVGFPGADGAPFFSPPAGQGVKFAVTESALVIDTVQVPVPEQPLPTHPLNVPPPAGVAVSVTGCA